MKSKKFNKINIYYYNRLILWHTFTYTFGVDADSFGYISDKKWETSVDIQKLVISRLKQYQILYNPIISKIGLFLQEL